MFVLKCIVYSVTIVLAMYFGYWELRLKAQLTDKELTDKEWGGISDPTILGDFAERIRRELVLKTLPKKARAKFNRAVALKFLFLALLVIEVLVLQNHR